MGEDVSKRTENAKYIRMSDGSYYVAMYDDAVHYQDENGDWQDIDNTLSESSAADSDDVTGVATSKGKHTVEFANNSNSSKLVAIKQDKYKISFNLIGANKSKAAMVTNPAEHAEDATELEKITVLNKMISSVKYADNGNGDTYEVCDIDNNITVCYNYDSLDRLISSCQCDKYLKNDDGTYSLYDNRKFNKRTNFSEQLFVYKPVSASSTTTIFSGTVNDLAKIFRCEKVSELEYSYSVEWGDANITIGFTLGQKWGLSVKQGAKKRVSVFLKLE